jgi:Fe2+ or Zn2+ uptake regulation protein
VASELAAPVEQNAQALRAAGLRVTASRLAVLDAVARWPHGTVEEIAASVRAQLGSVSQQAVYDALRALAERELVRHIEPAGSPARFEIRVADHHHVVCRRCGAIADVDGAVGSPPHLEATQTRGFMVDEAEVTYWGLCPACQSAPPEPPRPR